MRGEKVAIIMGAGASLADGLKKPQSKWPPLDRGFFAGGALKAYGTDLRPIVTYMEEHYGADLRKAENDSLERVMAVLYTDVYGGDLQTRAFEALRSLIRVFLKRLASTTNDIDMTSKSLLYRIVSSFLNAGVVPADVAIITFNQDIQAEKALAVLQKTKKWASKAVFSFPQCYHLPRGLRVTSPTNAASPRFTISSASSN
ncbi:MAG: hypothetical protein ACREMY_00255, partial [bacterium]